MGFSYESDSVDDVLDEAFETEEQEPTEVEEDIEQVDDDQPEQSETEEVGEDVFELDLDGEIVKMSKSELKDAISGKSADSDPDFEVYKQVKPLINQLREDPIMQVYSKYRSGGHESGAIIDGMFLQRYPQLAPVIENYFKTGGQQGAVGDEEPNFEDMTMAEEIEYRVNKGIEKALSQIAPTINTVAQKQQAYDNQYQINSIRANNDAVLENALTSSGYSLDLSKQELTAIAETMQDLYTNVDFARTPLTAGQAKRIVAAALGKGAASHNIAQQLSKQANMPRILRGTTTKQTKPSITQKVDNLSKSERLDRVSKLWQ